MKSTVSLLTYSIAITFLSVFTLNAQNTHPSKWRFVANIQDAYRINYALPFGAESNYPHQTGWSMGFDRSLLYKNHWNLRLGLSFTKQNEIWSNNRYWNLFEKPITKRDNQYYLAFPISLSSTRGRRFNTFFQVEPTFNLNDATDNFVNFSPGIDYKLNRFTSLYFSHGLQVRNFFSTQHNITNWHSQLGLKINLIK